MNFRISILARDPMIPSEVNGNLSCFWCSAEQGDSHQSDCAWIQAHTKPNNIRINDRFHIDEDYSIIKTSNGQAIPLEEPIIILRGRDHLALPLLRLYRILCEVDNCNDYFLGEVDSSITELFIFKNNYPERMKQPGVTRGK